MECENIVAYSIIALPILFFIGLFVPTLKRIQAKRTANARHYLIYKNIDGVGVNHLKGIYTVGYIERQYWDMKVIVKKIPTLLNLGLLKKEDLYIDLTGGDDTMGVSDDMLIELRIFQCCSYEKCGFWEKIGHTMKGYCDDMSGKYVYYKHSFTIDSKRGWDKWSNDWYIQKYGIFKEGYMYTDKGSGNRVHKEWLDKLRKLVDAYNSYEQSIKDAKINKINAKFKELES